MVMASNGVLDARERGGVLSRLAAERFDVLVIGGGITGAGTALVRSQISAGLCSTQPGRGSTWVCAS